MRVQSFILNNSDVQLLANSYIFINRNCRETGKGERRRDKEEVKRKQTRHSHTEGKKQTRQKKKNHVLPLLVVLFRLSVMILYLPISACGEEGRKLLYRPSKLHVNM